MSLKEAWLFPAWKTMNCGTQQSSPISAGYRICFLQGFHRSLAPHRQGQFRQHSTPQCQFIPSSAQQKPVCAPEVTRPFCMEQCLQMLLNLRASSGKERSDFGGNGNAAVEGKAAGMQVGQFLRKKTIQISWMQHRGSDYMAQTP